MTSWVLLAIAIVATGARYVLTFSRQAIIPQGQYLDDQQAALVFRFIAADAAIAAFGLAAMFLLFATLHGRLKRPVERLTLLVCQAASAIGILTAAIYFFRVDWINGGPGLGGDGVSSESIDMAVALSSIALSFACAALTWLVTRSSPSRVWGASIALFILVFGAIDLVIWLLSLVQPQIYSKFVEFKPVLYLDFAIKALHRVVRLLGLVFVVIAASERWRVRQLST